MRTSLKRTPAAVLRAIIGITDYAMADLLKCSIHSVHSLESGRLKMSEDMAVRMTYETGVSSSWLLDGDPKAPPRTFYGDPYTKAFYERTQANKADDDRPDRGNVMFEALDLCARLVAILLSAKTGGQWRMARYRARTAILEMAKNFGQEPAAYKPSYFDDYDVDQALAIMDELVETAIFSGKTEAVRALARELTENHKAPGKRKRSSKPRQ